MSEIVLASHNAGKIKEFSALLANTTHRIVPQSHFNLASIEETGLTFVENALLKARYASEKTGLPSFADDSGLTIDALAGAPGIYSARYGNSETDNIQKVLSELTDIPKPRRNAQFYCVIVYLRHAQDPTPLICQGIWRGSILFTPQGQAGFGYDPIFYVPTHDCSAAELPPEIKNKISHRGQAMEQLLEQLTHDS